MGKGKWMFSSLTTHPSKVVHGKNGAFGNGSYHATTIFSVGGRLTWNSNFKSIFLMEGQRRNTGIRLQVEFYYTRTCTYDLLHHYDDPPTCVIKLKFYQWKLQLQLQKIAWLKVSHREHISSLAGCPSSFDVTKLLKRQCQQPITTLHRRWHPNNDTKTRLASLCWTLQESLRQDIDTRIQHAHHKADTSRKIPARH
jgi:hypothetical protein